MSVPACDCKREIVSACVQRRGGKGEYDTDTRWGVGQIVVEGRKRSGQDSQTCCCARVCVWVTLVLTHACVCG